MDNLHEAGSDVPINEDNILQRGKKNVKINKQETLMILRSYLSHPTRWTDIISNVKENIGQLAREVRHLYNNSTDKQLKDRMSTKIKKLIAADDIEDDEIRTAVGAIRDMERRHVRRQQQAPPEPEVRDARDDMAANMSSSSEDQENAADEELPIPGPSENRRGRRSRKRPLVEIIRENQLLYNRFIKKKVPKLLRELGISSSDSDSD